MDSDPIIRLAEQELANLDVKRRETAAFIAWYKRLKAIASGEPEPEPDEAMVAMIRRSPPADAVLSAVHDILQERGDALTLAAIFDGLLKRGVIVGGKNPKQNLSQKLSAHPLLKSYGKRGWYFADKLPPCLLPNVRLPADEMFHEEGPAMDVAGPLQTNGATDWYSEAPREGRAPV